MPGPNPLSTMKPSADADHPAMGHARAWQNVNGMKPGDIQEKVTIADALLPMIARLAANPNVKPKDVIRMAADSTARAGVPPSESVKFISSMPSDADKIQPWLRQHYEAMLSAQIHMKAALMQQAQGAQQPQPMAPQGMPV